MKSNMVDRVTNNGPRPVKVNGSSIAEVNHFVRILFSLGYSVFPNAELQINFSGAESLSFISNDTRHSFSFYYEENWCHIRDKERTYTARDIGLLLDLVLRKSKMFLSYYTRILDGYRVHVNNQNTIKSQFTLEYSYVDSCESSQEPPQSISLDSLNPQAAILMKAARRLNFDYRQDPDSSIVILWTGEFAERMCFLFSNNLVTLRTDWAEFSDPSLWRVVELAATSTTNSDMMATELLMAITYEEALME